jgi:hypothetical protein
MEQVTNRSARFRVEIPGRFVTEKQRWAIHQGPGDRDALALAAGEFSGRCVALPDRPTC